MQIITQCSAQKMNALLLWCNKDKHKAIYNKNRCNYADRSSQQYTVIGVFICTSNTKTCTPLLKKKKIELSHTLV